MAGVNYAEERAYWYLRLNGFFLLTDFVVHKSPIIKDDICNIKYRRDIDLIGIRFPYVWEEIGGQQDDFDSILPQQCGDYKSYESLGKPFAVICEVKSGDNYDQDKLNISMENQETKSAIEVALKRIGICPHEEITSEYIDNFSCNRFINMGGYAVAKVLFSNSPTRDYQKYCSINLDDARKFILKRILNYIDEKQASRLFFDSIQLQDNIDLISAMLRKNQSKKWIMEVINSI